MAQQPPVGSRPPHSRGFYITHNDAPQSIGFPWTSDQLVAETSTWQHTTPTTNIHVPQWDSNPTISEGNQLQTYALDRAATGTGGVEIIMLQIKGCRLGYEMIPLLGI